MPFIYKPLPIQVSQINRSNPLSKGIVFDWKNNARTARVPFDNVSKKFGTVTGSPTELLRRYGSGVDFGTNCAYSWTDLPRMTNFDYVSLEIIYIRDGPGNVNYGQLFQHRDAATGIPWFQYYNDNGDGGWGMGLATHYTATERVWSVPYPTNGVLVHDIFTYDHTNKNNTPLAWRNGVPLTVTSRFDSGWTKTINANDIRIGGEPTPIAAWDGQIFLARYWNRLLTKNEPYQLFADPGVIYRSNPVFGKATAAAPSTSVKDMISMGFIPFAR